MNGSFRFCFYNFHFRSLSFGIGLWFLPKNSANRSICQIKKNTIEILNKVLKLSPFVKRPLMYLRTPSPLIKKNPFATFRTNIIFVGLYRDILGNEKKSCCKKWISWRKLNPQHFQQTTTCITFGNVHTYVNWKFLWVL